MSEKTSKKIASSAGKVLSESTSKSAKKIAASALVQKDHGITSPSVARAASKILKDKRFSKTTRSLAGSVLTQTANRKKK